MSVKVFKVLFLKLQKFQTQANFQENYLHVFIVKMSVIIQTCVMPSVQNLLDILLTQNLALCKFEESAGM